MYFALPENFYMHMYRERRKIIEFKANNKTIIKLTFTA